MTIDDSLSSQNDPHRMTLSSAESVKIEVNSAQFDDFYNFAIQGVFVAFEPEYEW